MSNLSTSVFRLAKFVFSANLEVSTCEMFLMSVFVALLNKSTLTFIFLPKRLNDLGQYSLNFYTLLATRSFLLIELLNELS